LILSEYTGFPQKGITPRHFFWAASGSRALLSRLKPTL
jgi:hypothetical protein